MDLGGARVFLARWNGVRRLRHRRPGPERRLPRRPARRHRRLLRGGRWPGSVRPAADRRPRASRSLLSHAADFQASLTDEPRCLTLTGLTPIAFARAASHPASTGLLRGPLGTLARLVPTRPAQLAGVVLR